MSKCLPDTNVFSKVSAGDNKVRNLVESSDPAIDVTVYVECLQGSKSNSEKLLIKKYLSNFPLLLLSPEISKRAIHLIDKYSNSHGLLLPDALIASTAIEHDLTRLTYNIGDFKFVENLRFEQPGV